MNMKINTICFIFLFLFLISAISAADCENETQTIPQDIATEDIESDKEKQDAINWYKKMTEYEIERSKRIKRRNGKHDWEIAVKEFRGKKRYLRLALECNNITESYLKGLRLSVDIGEKEADNIGYVVKKFFKIPLSWSQFYIQFIYKDKEF